MSRRRMNTKQTGPEKGSEQPTSSSADKVTATPGVRSYLPWVLAAVALTGTSYFLAGMSLAKKDAGMTRLPESYALCGEPGKIYTVSDG